MALSCELNESSHKTPKSKKHKKKSTNVEHSINNEDEFNSSLISPESKKRKVDLKNNKTPSKKKRKSDSMNSGNSVMIADSGTLVEMEPEKKTPKNKKKQKQTKTDEENKMSSDIKDTPRLNKRKHGQFDREEKDLVKFDQGEIEPPTKKSKKNKKKKSKSLESKETIQYNEPIKETSSSQKGNHDDIDEEEKKKIREKKRLKKQEKKKKKAEEKADHLSGKAAVNSQKLALEYLHQWEGDRLKWYFQKRRQTWLLKNMHDTNQVPDAEFTILLKYLEGMKGMAREVTAKKAQEMLAQEQEEKEESSDDEQSDEEEENKEKAAKSQLQEPKLSEEQLDRMRQVVQILT